MSGIWQDLRHAGRMLSSRPGWTAVAVLSLTLGIGVNTTAFSVADAMFLRPMPVAAPDEMVTLRAMAAGGGEDGFSFLDYRELIAGTNAFSGITGFSNRGSMLKTNGEAELVPVLVVPGNYFEVLGVSPLLGRTLQPGIDTGLDAPPAVVLGHNVWQRKFGGDPGIVGRAIHLNDTFVTVVGVLPAFFPGLERGTVNDLWLSPSAWVASTGARGDFEERGARQFELIARLRHGATKEMAQAQVDAVGRRLAAAWPATSRDVTFRASMVSQELQSKAFRPVALLLAIVGLVLWIACGNVAGLLLAQGEGRRREIGIRQAMGATRARLIRQMITESALLACLGAAGGLLLSKWLLSALPSLLPPSPFVLDFGLRLDERALGFTVLAALATVLLFGLAPALRASRNEVVPALKGEDPRRGSRRLAMRSMVVVGQVALAVVLLNTAGLLLRSFVHTRSESPGYDAARNIVGVFMVHGMNMKESQATGVYERLREETLALPGVRHATYARRLPLSMATGGATVKVEFPGLSLPEDKRRAGIHYNQVGPGYFETLGTRILRGRGFDARDSEQGESVVLVSDAFARRYYPRGDALDKFLVVRGKPARIVGVAEDARMNSIHEAPEPYLYIPFAQFPSGESTLIVESAAEPGPLVQPLKQTVRRVQPSSVILLTTTLHDHLRDAMFMDWVQAVLSSGVATLGVLLAAVGLFAAVSFAVGRRIREFGIRLAIGARRIDVFRMVMRQALVLGVAGVAAGLAGALLVARLLSGFLYGVRANDVLTLGASAFVAIVVAVAASLHPARRAVRVDPVQALRYE